VVPSLYPHPHFVAFLAWWSRNCELQRETAFVEAAGFQGKHGLSPRVSGSSVRDASAGKQASEELSSVRLLFVSMKEGGLSIGSVVSGSGSSLVLVVGSGAHLSIASSAGGPGDIGGRPRGRKSEKGRQAARRKAAPPEAGVGAKGWLLVSMCQIASVSSLAMSIWATFAPRCLPRRFLLRW
jgi:hypothetical protein